MPGEDFDSVTKYYSIRNQVERGEADIKSSNDREADKRAWQDCGAENEPSCRKECDKITIETTGMTLLRSSFLVHEIFFFFFFLWFLSIRQTEDRGKKHASRRIAVNTNLYV